MNFDEFDAPQFVDFSEENFDAVHEGDSWFSSDSSHSDLQIEELEYSDDDDDPSILCPSVDTPSRLLLDNLKPPDSADLPSWARKASETRKVDVVDAESRQRPSPPLPPTTPADSVVLSANTAIPKTSNVAAASDASGAAGACPGVKRAPRSTAGDANISGRFVDSSSVASASAWPIARWRRAVKRASLEHLRRQSLGGARGKVALKAKEKIRTPTKNKEVSDQHMAKRMKTVEKPKRKSNLNKTYSAASTSVALPSRPPPRPILTSGAPHRVDRIVVGTHDGIGSADVARGDSGASNRKRVRGLEPGVEADGSAPRTVVQFSAKTATGAKQTFQFAPNRAASSSSAALAAVPGEASELVRFQGRPAPTRATTDCFRPKAARRRNTEFKEFHFHTEDRAQVRNQLNVVKAQNLARQRVVEERRRREEEEKERQELRRLREALVHKPTPILHGLPFIVTASAKKLTNPESPNLSYKQNNKRQS